MSTFPLATLAAQITAEGITAPTYSDIMQSLQESFRLIYGADAVISPDSQDGQMLGIFAKAIYDANQTSVDTYNAFSPAKAQGAGLSSVVKINGITRQVPTPSTAPVLLVGVVGTLIENGKVGDNAGQDTQWTLPASVTIPISGEITVTATCTEEGATEAPTGTLTVILTPTLGWQSATNTSDATTGSPVESDAALRRRQARSTGLPALSVLEALFSAIADLDGVTRSTIYENPTGATDGEGVPGHSISAVVQGGDTTEIAETIALYKTPGTGTYGTTTVVVVDSKGIPNTINFFVLALVSIEVQVSIKTLPGWLSTTGDLIKASIAQYLNNLSIGEDSYTFDLVSPANLQGSAALQAAAALYAGGLTQEQLEALSATYYLSGLEQAEVGDPLGTANVSIPFNAAAAGDVDDISVVIVP